MSGPAGDLFLQQGCFHHQLACAVVSTIPDTTTSLVAGIAIDSAKDHLHLGSWYLPLRIPPPSRSSLIIGDRAVDQRECPTIVGDATTSYQPDS